MGLQPVLPLALLAAVAHGAALATLLQLHLCCSLGAAGATTLLGLLHVFTLGRVRAWAVKMLVWEPQLEGQTAITMQRFFAQLGQAGRVEATWALGGFKTLKLYTREMPGLLSFPSPFALL